MHRIAIYTQCKKKRNSSTLKGELLKYGGKLSQTQKSFIVSEELYKLKPLGSQLAELYGLPKVYGKKTRLRPIVAMPGSASHALAALLGNCLQNFLRLTKSSMLIRFRDG